MGSFELYFCKSYKLRAKKFYSLIPACAGMTKLFIIELCKYSLYNAHALVDYQCEVSYPHMLNSPHWLEGCEYLINSTIA